MKNEMVSVLEDTLPLSKFRVSSSGELLDSDEYADGYREAISQQHPNRQSVLPSQFIKAKVNTEAVLDTHIAKLVELLDSALSPYVDPERSSFDLRLPVQGFQGEVISSLDVAGFAERVIRCAALHGTTETVDMVLRWASGEPAAYSHMVALSGIRLDEKGLELLPGVELVRLDRNNLLRHVPEELVIQSLSSPRPDGIPSLENGVLRIHVDGDPVITSPDAQTRMERHTYDKVYVSFPRFDTSRLVDALSLVGNCPVVETQEWHNFDPKVCSLTGYCDEPHPCFTRRRPGSLVFPIKPDHLAPVRHVFDRLDDRELYGVLEIPIRKWTESKLTQNDVAAATDLRVALESLLLDDENNLELRFRLPLRGAWYLGTSFEERWKFFYTLRDAYDLCSGAVHTGRISDDAGQVKSTLYAAQDLCCGAIRRRIYEGAKPDWTKLVLDAEPLIVSS